MSVLVTGALGFLGRAVVERLLIHGDTDIGCLVRPAGDVSVLEDLRKTYPDARIRYIFGNLTSPSDVERAVDGITTVYHLAAGMRGMPGTIFTNSVVASKRLLEALKGKKQRVVLVSSLGVCDTSNLEKGSLIGENIKLDPHPEKRNVYFLAKIWQERLFREEAKKGGINLVVLRPGVLYGAGNPNRGFPSRVGISIGSLLLVFGDGYALPFSHVLNCAEAVVLAGRSQTASGQTYNVVDDNMPTAVEYLRHYRQHVGKIRSIRLPFPIAMLLATAVESYHVRSYGQIPAVLTPYETSAMCKGFRFDTRKIKALGWKQIVATEAGMRETFAFLKTASN